MIETRLNTKINLGQRIETANKLLRSAQEITHGLEDSRIKNIFEFIGTIRIGEPITHGDQWGVAKLKDSPALVPLYLSDGALHPYFKTIYEKDRFTYLERAQTIFFRADDNLSDTWRGILLLH